MTEKQGQLQTKTLVNALQHGIITGPGDTGTVIRIHITPLIGQCRTCLLVKKYSTVSDQILQLASRDSLPLLRSGSS